MALRFGSNAKATLHSPSAALTRNSFILAWREPFSVSTRGLPSCGPNSCKSRDSARISTLTSSCKLLNSASNSSASSTVHRSISVCLIVHMPSSALPCCRSALPSGAPARTPARSATVAGSAAHHQRAADVARGRITDLDQCSKRFHRITAIGRHCCRNRHRKGLEELALFSCNEFQFKPAEDVINDGLGVADLGIVSQTGALHRYAKPQGEIVDINSAFSGQQRRC